jgi:isoquinoline 1-oxidoreductase alpha subunit
MKINVNGNEHEVDPAWQEETLLDVLRDHLGMTGTRFSCGTGQCGACLVHVDGVPTNSCIMPVGAIAGRRVLTIEGLASEDGTLHPLQQAWIEEAVPQCGYCQSGQIMRALALLDQTPDPSDDDIDRAMNGNLCRCGTYPRIRRSITKAAIVLRESG